MKKYRRQNGGQLRFGGESVVAFVDVDVASKVAAALLMMMAVVVDDDAIWRGCRAGFGWETTADKGDSRNASETVGGGDEASPGR